MAVRARKAALTQFGGLFLSAQKSLPHSLACPHSLGAAQEHPNSIRRCFKHGRAGRILHSGRTERHPSMLCAHAAPMGTTRSCWLRAALTALLFEHSLSLKSGDPAITVE